MLSQRYNLRSHPKVNAKRRSNRRSSVKPHPRPRTGSADVVPEKVDHVKEIAPSVRASKKCASPPQRREGDRCLIPKATFSNYIRGIGKKHTPPPRTMKWSESALSALQKVTEHQLKSMLNKAKTIALLNGRRLVLPRDIYAVSLCAAPSLH
ncbi:hypothetical protein GCK32_002017 [Trichostrongylus colubriformis]|uniref:Uncharacterized protein n=1 Tax=Trichostrongylus colubriformis TaxID=6319 RepID=A0AAN8EU35_TRICO